jgi:hypothetical protein
VISGNTLSNLQTAQVSTGGGSGTATADNVSKSKVTDAGVVGATSGAAGGAGTGSGAGSASGTVAQNSVTDQSVVSVKIGGANEAPVSVTATTTRTIENSGAAGAQSGATGGTAPAADAKTSSPTPPANGSPCTTGLTNDTVVRGSTTQVVPPPTASGRPITVEQKQSTTIVNDGRATPAPLASPVQATTVGAPATPSASAAAVTTTGGSGSAVAQGLKADNAVTNDAAVILNITGGNYAPITIVVDTVTRIVNTGAAIAESGGDLIGGLLQATSGNPGGQRAQGALVTNDVGLGSDVTVRINGDNHTPISIVIEIAASLWNRGVAMLGGSPSDASTTARSTTGAGSATGLIVRNRVNLWAHAYIDILGSNYAPIDVHLRIVSETVNIGFAASRTGGQAPIPDSYERADDVASGSASCLGSATMALVGNVQSATVITPKDASAKRASNSFDTSVASTGQVGCASGPAAGRGSNVTSGAVEAVGSVSRVVIGSVQTANASAEMTAPKVDVSVERDQPESPKITSPSTNTSGRSSSAARGAVTPIVEQRAKSDAPHAPVAAPVRAAAPVYFPTYQEYTPDPSEEDMPLQTLSTSGTVSVAGAEGGPPMSPVRSDLVGGLILLLIALALFLVARLGLRLHGSRQPVPAAA